MTKTAIEDLRERVAELEMEAGRLRQGLADKSRTMGSFLTDTLEIAGGMLIFAAVINFIWDASRWLWLIIRAELGL